MVKSISDLRSQPSLRPILANLPPEAELLLSCARTRLSPAETVRLMNLLRTGLDWTYLIRLAARHGLLPLLYWHLNRTQPAAVPRATMAQLWAYFEANTRRNQVLTVELLRLLELLAEHGIQAMPHKGPVLAESLYGHPGLREFVDLDILVPRRQLEPAQALLAAQGYRPRFVLSPAQAAAYVQARRHHHVHLVHAQSGVMVELHWRLGGAYFAGPVEDEQWWAGLQRVPLGGRQVPGLAPEELLLSLCLHGARHHWASLAWLADVAELIRPGPQLDWSRLVSLAEELEVERMVYLGLYLADELLGALLPPALWARLATRPDVTALAAVIVRTLFQADDAAAGAFGRTYLSLRLIESVPWRLRYGLELIFAPSLVEWSQLRLPAPLFFLYYPLRLGRLTAKHGLRLLKS